ncbi:MAG: CoA ester lyase [Salaquimonas sp.]
MVFIPENTQDYRLCRSALFMPASNARALEKAKTLDCDCLIFDLEDAVADGGRGDALNNLKVFVKGADFGRRQTVIRINAFDSDQFIADLAIAADCGVDAILLPKVESAKALEATEIHLRTAGCNSSLWAMIETPIGLINLRDIASASNRLRCLVVGPNDLARTIGVKAAKGRPDLHPLLMMIIATARANNLSVLDGVYNNFRDTEGFGEECLQGSNMGFDGKTLIHPAQIDAANEAFSPSKSELAEARKIVKAFGAKENADKGVIQIDGKMVERLHFDSAQMLLTFFD